MKISPMQIKNQRYGRRLSQILTDAWSCANWIVSGKQRYWYRSKFFHKFSYSRESSRMLTHKLDRFTFMIHSFHNCNWLCHSFWRRTWFITVLLHIKYCPSNSISLFSSLLKLLKRYTECISRILHNGTNIYSFGRTKLEFWWQ